jgi:hypothetical protein
MPTMRLATRNFQLAQQWCAEMADIAGESMELVLASPTQHVTVRCDPITSGLLKWWECPAALQLQAVIDNLPPIDDWGV